MDKALALGHLTGRIVAANGCMQLNFQKAGAPKEFKPGRICLRLFSYANEIGDEGHVGYQPTQEISTTNREALIALRNALNEALEKSSTEVPKTSESFVP